jgi:hypothetical protein
MQILCKTYFDCSATGVTGSYKPSQLPFVDRSGKSVVDFQSWNSARNCQRNWETLLQMISLRAQPLIIQEPTENNGVWQFVFEVETTGVYSANGDAENLDGLLTECSGIPMCVELGETNTQQPQLIVSGTDQNIWFETVNNTLE